MSYSVSYIASLFHEFEESEAETIEPFPKKNSKHKFSNKALILATQGANTKNLKTYIGNKYENEMLNRYETISAQQIVERNEKNRELEIDIFDKKIYITGRLDGFVDKGQIVIEHKRRINGFLNTIPYHEKVQCHLYMKMSGSKTTHLVETFKNHIKVHTLNFDENIWNEIILRLKNSSDFIK